MFQAGGARAESELLAELRASAALGVSILSKSWGDGAGGMETGAKRS